MPQLAVLSAVAPDPDARVRAAAAILLATAVLASAALYNGYPLTFWDTRAYLESAATLMPRADRLIGYAFLLRIASWTGTLWPLVIAQCALLSWLLWRVFARLRPQLGVLSYLTRVGLLAGCTALPWIAGQLMADIFTPLLTGTLWPLVIAQCALLSWLLWRVFARLRPQLGVLSYLTRVGLLAGCTALPWIAGQLMADIFTPLLVLALWLYVEDESLVRAQRVGLLALIAVCVTVHLTHLPLGLGLLVLAWLWLRARHAPALQRRLLAPALALLVGFAAIGGWNAARTGRFTLASGSDTFLLGRLVDSGIASRMLDAHCGERDYWLCPHRARLPMGTDELLWVDALQLQPWEHPAAVSGEVSRLLRDSLREVPLLHAQVALVSTLRVLGRFATGEGLDGDARPLIELHLGKLAPGDVLAFVTSRQQRDAIAVAKLRQLHTPIGWMLIASALLGLVRGPWRKDLGSLELRFVWFVALAWLLNAILSANLSGIYDRYESRLLWLFGVWFLARVKLPELEPWRSWRRLRGHS